MGPGEERLTEGTIKSMFKNIQDDLEEIKGNHREDKKELHKRCNGIEGCINTEVKPVIQANKTDLEWVKAIIWFTGGIGTSALLLVIGVIISSWMGG